MQFFTKVPISKTNDPISYHSKVVSIGSCFAQNIGEKFNFYKFQNTTNPFGIIFNPSSIEKLISRAINKEYFTEEDIFFYNERWQSFEIHSELSHADKDFFLNLINATLDSFSKEIHEASHVIITLGTSWVYKENSFGNIVANCHKVPQKSFKKHLLSAEEISISLENITKSISKINSQCTFIFTISPVRHIKDGFVENQVSKSNLISAVYNLIQNQPENSRFSYFPSYEIMMDELRDYRFYSSDLLHPNATAIDYIWSRFMETTVEPNSISTMKEIETIQRSLQHRSFNPESISHQKFLQNLNVKIENVQKSYPFIEFSKE